MLWITQGTKRLYYFIIHYFVLSVIAVLSMNSLTALGKFSVTGQV
jgi:hypothetical protein